MRVIAGTARSLPLKTVRGSNTRPTTDRIKETLFNMISAEVPGCRFLDLFAGSGAIGIEALSRGAQCAAFVEQDRNALQVIRQNLNFTHLTENARVIAGDVIRTVTSMDGEKSFGVIFMDPPYDNELEKRVLEVLRHNSIADPDTLIIDAKSGTSGAGRSAKTANLFCEVNESIKPYGAATHRHTPEIEDQIACISGHPSVVQFTPHLIPMNRGIFATVYASLQPGVTEEDFRKAYEEEYKDETFVRVLGDGRIPETRWVKGSNYADVGFKIDQRTGRAVMMGAIDNIVKGAAGQAVQNMNLLFGLPEDSGLRMVPESV